MNLIGTKVKHIKYGEGEIIKVNEKSVIVLFSHKTVEFQYHAGLLKFFEIYDESAKAEISRSSKKKKLKKSNAKNV